MLSQQVKIAIAASAVIAAAAMFAVKYGPGVPAAPGDRGGGQNATRGMARIGGPFELIDQNSKVRRNTDFRGRLMLVFFGYTNCPDICPTVLRDISLVMERLGNKASSVQPIMVTVDPARDTPARLKAYLNDFDRRIIALTGTEQAVARAAKSYLVYRARSKTASGAAPPDHPADGHAHVQKTYLVDHTGNIYLLGRDGRYLAHFKHAMGADDMAAAIEKHL